MDYDASVYTTSGASPSVETAYAQDALLPFRNNLVFGAAAKEKVWDLDGGDPMPGDNVKFTLYSNFEAKTSPLSETGDPTAIDLTMSQVQISLIEYGNVVTRGAKVKATSFLDLDPDIVYLIGYNAATSIDLVARAAFDAQVGTAYNLYIGAAGGSVGGTAYDIIRFDDILTWAHVRKAYNKLFRSNVPPPRMLRTGQQLYGAVIHPDTLADLRAQTGAGSWRLPKEYADADELRTGEMGANEGMFFQVTNHSKVSIGAGAGTVASTDVYTSYFYGLEAVGKANGNVARYSSDGSNGEFSVVISGPHDKLKRIYSIGWKSLCGYGAIRNVSLYKIHHASAFSTGTSQAE